MQGAASWALDRKARDRVQYAWQDNGMTAAQPHVFYRLRITWRNRPGPGVKGFGGRFLKTAKTPGGPPLALLAGRARLCASFFMGAGDEKLCAFRESAGVKGGKKPCYLENM